MRKLIVAEHITLDGVIQGGGSPDEDPSDGFRLGGWSVPYNDDAGGEYIEELFSQPYELLLGRRTYDIWASYWPNVPADAPFIGIANQFNATVKHVATHRPESLAWRNSRALKGNVTDAVSALKKAGGPLLMAWGSSQLVRPLLAAGLVDELWLLIYPIVLGHGKRLFGDDAKPSSFTVVKSVASPSGVLLTRYALGGDVRTGSFANP